MDAADAMLHVHAVISARAADGAVARGENDCLPLIGVNHFGFGLSARLLLDQQELPAIPIAALLAQEKNHLQRESNFAVNILMQAVVSADFVVKKQRGGLGLTGFVADFQEGRVFGGKAWTLFAEVFSPLIRQAVKMRVSCG